MTSQNCKPNKERTNQEQVTKQMVYEQDGAGSFMAELAEIPEDWEPSDKVREWAAAQGIGEADFKAPRRRSSGSAGSGGINTIASMRDSRTRSFKIGPT